MTAQPSHPPIARIAPTLSSRALARAEAAEARARAARARYEAARYTLGARAISAALGGGGGSGGGSGGGKRVVAGGHAPQASGLGDYDAARRSRLSKGSRPRMKSADAELTALTLTELRAACQRKMRNNAVARCLVRRLVDRVVGQGPIPQAMSGDPAWDQQAEAVWARVAPLLDARGRMGFGELCRLQFSSSLVDGDAGAAILEPDAAAGAWWPRVQVIEAERIGGPWSPLTPRAASPADPVIVGGIEVDPLGRPLAYHVRDWAPGGNRLEDGSTRIPAEDFLLVCETLRPGQTRGEPRLAALLQILEHLGSYIQATVVAAHVGASPGLIFKKNDPATAQALLPGENVARGDGGEDRTLEFQMGMNFMLGVNEDVEQFKPEQPTTQFDGFVRMMLRLAGTDMDLPLEMVLLDASQSTAYAGRSALAATRAPVAVRREALEHQLTRPIWRRVIAMAMLAGELPWNDAWERHAWVWPQDPTFEPDREAAADKLRLDNHLATLAEVCARAGQDWRDVLAQRAAEQEEMRRLGLAAPAPSPSATASGVVAGKPGAGAVGDAEDAGNTTGAAP